MDKEFASLLTHGLTQLGIPFQDEQIRLLTRYYNELLKWNSRINLIGDSTTENIVTRHFLDSLAGLSALRGFKGNSWADIGSGAGFPGLVISVFLPGRRMTLIDRSQKRCGFLRNCVAVLGLSSRVAVVERELEQIQMQYEVVVFRAFRNLPEFYSCLRSIVLPGGVMAAYKGRREKIEGELKKLPGDASVSIIPLEVPGLGEERHLLTIAPQPQEKE